MSITPKREPIREGSQFVGKDGEVWTVTEIGRFGRPYWVVSADQCRQTIFHRNVLETMERLPKGRREHE